MDPMEQIKLERLKRERILNHQDKFNKTYQEHERIFAPSKKWNLSKFMLFCVGCSFLAFTISAPLLGMLTNHDNMVEASRVLMGEWTKKLMIEEHKFQQLMLKTFREAKNSQVINVTDKDLENSKFFTNDRVQMDK